MNLIIKESMKRFQKNGSRIELCIQRRTEQAWMRKWRFYGVRREENFASCFIKGSLNVKISLDLVALRAL